MPPPCRLRRVHAALAVGAVVLTGTVGACSSERAAPVPTRPTPPPTVTVAPGVSVPGSITADTASAATASADSGPEVTASVAATSTTRPPPPTEAQWARFDELLGERLIGRGDYSASFAVRRDGALLHAEAYGVRVPLLPAPPATDAAGETLPTTTSTSSTTTSSTTTSTTTTTTTTTTLPPTTEPAPGRGPSTSTGRRPATTSTSSSTSSTTTSSTSTTTTTIPAPGTEPAETTDRFRIASISKVVTAAVVMQLVEAGELSLDEPVLGRLGSELGVRGIPADVAAVTVRQLLSHTSGFGTHRDTFFGGDADSCEEAGRKGMVEGLRRSPGTDYHYSNMNYCLLGLVVEDVTGESYETVVQRRLLAPLGIDGMRLAGTFDPDPSEVEHPSTPGRNYMEALGAAGSWVATATDVVTIADALEGSRPGWHPLSQGSMAIMRVPAPTGSPPPAVRESWYGLGQIVFADGSWGHTGTIENTHASVLVRPDGVTWALLISGEHPGESDDIRGIVDQTLADAGIRF